MTQREYEKCIPGWDDPNKQKGWPGDAKPTCGISFENIERKDAVKLPGQPKVCYDRKTLKKWFKNSKTNPQSREKVEDNWIDTNMGEKDCEPQIETVFNVTSGGKRKTRKSKKSKRKARKTRK